MTVLKEVKTKKEQKAFLEFVNELYKDSEYYVPSLYLDEVKIFNKNNLYYDQSEAKYYLAYKDGKVVGRIGVILQKASNEKWNQKRVRFTRFDSINDQEVANALLKTAEDYAKEKGMEEVVGPLGFSDLEREGLLIEGFYYLSTYEEQYNYPYYKDLLENYGYRKDVDWIEQRLLPDQTQYEKLKALDERLARHNKSDIHFVNIKSFKKYTRIYKDQFFEILDKTYDQLYGTVPFTDGMKNLLINNFSLLINMRYLVSLVDKDNNIVAFAIAFPSISEDLLHTGGHLNLITLFKILRTVRHPKRIDLGLIGIDNTKATSSCLVMILAKLSSFLNTDNIEYYETNLNLEDNKSIINIWNHFDFIQHKRRRSYIKKL